MPGVYENPAILNLHLRLWESISPYWMSGRRFAQRKAEDTAAGTHLAWASVKIAGYGILGILFESAYFKIKL